MEKYQFPRIKNEIQFEDFTRDLLNLIHSDTSFQLYGRKGQSQNGLDGYSTFHNIFFQCKHKSFQYVKDTKLEEELVAELDKAKNTILKLSKNTISKFLFFTTHPNTIKLQDKARLLSNDEIIVEYWGWESIESYLNDFYLFENKDFYKKYFPELATRLSSSIPSQLTIKSSTHDNNFIGREDEVKVIDTMLKDSSSLLLINGIGGIGKSSLANYYLYTRENEFDYYGFIEGLESFISEFRNSLDLKSEKEEELYREIMFKLQDLKGKKLLVIDNVEDIESHKELVEMILALHKYDYKILFTSRRKIKNVKAYPLGTLSLDDARELFLSYCKTDELEKVDEIINYLGLHTLFIKLVAETIENEGYSLDNILEKFANGELSKIELIDDESGDEVTFNQNLQELFSMQNLKDEYVLLLKRLAVLPSIDIELSFLEEILGKEPLKGRLNFLVGRGWLIKNDESYKLHQIIKEFLLANYAPCFEDIERQIDYVNELFNDTGNVQLILENTKNIIYLESVYSAVNKYSNPNEKIKTLLNSLALVYKTLEDTKKAILIYEENEKVFDKDSYFIATTWNNLGECYRGSNNEKALKYFKKGEELIEKLSGRDSFDISVIYNNLGLTYLEMKKYKKALEYQEKCFNIYNKLSNHSTSIARTYHHMAQIYVGQAVDEKKIKKKKSLVINAKEKYEQALAINTKELGENNYYTIVTLEMLSDLLFFYQSYFLTDLELIYKYKKRVNNFYEDYFPKESSRYKQSKDDLKNIEEKLNNQKKIVPKKISRNDSCPCNSGKKYKKCCGKPK